MFSLWWHRSLLEKRQRELWMQKLSLPPEFTCQHCYARQSVALSLLVYRHSFADIKVIPKKEVSTLLPWAHIAISNAKRMMLNTFHAMKPEYLQNYLNEFCYMFNRRYFGERLFDRLMVAAVCYKNKFRYNIR